MSKFTKFAATAVITSLVASSAIAGGLSGAAVESEPFVVEETRPASSLGGAAPLLLLGAVAIAIAVAADDDDDDSTSGTN